HARRGLIETHGELEARPLGHVLDDGGEARRVSQGLHGLTYARSRETKRSRDIRPRLLTRLGGEDHELNLRAPLAAAVREETLEDAEEGRPSLPDALELLVPVVRAREPAVHDAHATHAAGPRFDRPLRRHRGRARAHAALVLGGEPPRRIPLLDLRLRIH